MFSLYSRCWYLFSKKKGINRDLEHVSIALANISSKYDSTGGVIMVSTKECSVHMSTSSGEDIRISLLKVRTYKRINPYICLESSLLQAAP